MATGAALGSGCSLCRWTSPRRRLADIINFLRYCSQYLGGIGCGEQVHAEETASRFGKPLDGPLLLAPQFGLSRLCSRDGPALLALDPRRFSSLFRPSYQAGTTRRCDGYCATRHYRSRFSSSLPIKVVGWGYRFVVRG
jgi:hypothetical protein